MILLKTLPILLFCIFLFLNNASAKALAAPEASYVKESKTTNTKDKILSAGLLPTSSSEISFYNGAKYSAVDDNGVRFAAENKTNIDHVVVDVPRIQKNKNPK